MADRSSGGTTWPSPDQRRALPKPDQARKGRPRPFEATRFRRHREGSQVAERYSRRSRVAAYRATNRSLKSARRRWRPLREECLHPGSDNKTEVRDRRSNREKTALCSTQLIAIPEVVTMVHRTVMVVRWRFLLAGG